ncbi:hypothetical protein B0H16DRAFT_1899744 [Mycena metata]|uniref:Uncharacterized protein n=1 Tax=Mycena metata TaxID=1033252 RepID=A0AAD7ME22_9AGAR|nr:hypothetical protein B0H16DRAFT_1899744 [Mycena metata]
MQDSDGLTRGVLPLPGARDRTNFPLHHLDLPSSIFFHPSLELRRSNVAYGLWKMTAVAAADATARHAYISRGHFQGFSLDFPGEILAHLPASLAPETKNPSKSQSAVKQESPGPGITASRFSSLITTTTTSTSPTAPARTPPSTSPSTHTQRPRRRRIAHRRLRPLALPSKPVTHLGMTTAPRPFGVRTPDRTPPFRPPAPNPPTPPHHRITAPPTHPARTSPHLPSNPAPPLHFAPHCRSCASTPPTLPGRAFAVLTLSTSLPLASGQYRRPHPHSILRPRPPPRPTAPPFSVTPNCAHLLYAKTDAQTDSQLILGCALASPYTTRAAPNRAMGWVNEIDDLGAYLSSSIICPNLLIHPPSHRINAAYRLRQPFAGRHRIPWGFQCRLQPIFPSLRAAAPAVEHGLWLVIRRDHCVLVYRCMPRAQARSTLTHPLCPPRAPPYCLVGNARPPGSRILTPHDVPPISMPRQLRASK